MKNLLFGLLVLPLFSFTSLKTSPSETVDNMLYGCGEGYTELTYCDKSECIVDGSMTPLEISAYLIDKNKNCDGGSEEPVTVIQ